MSVAVSFAEYLAALSPLTAHIDPTVDTSATTNLRDATRSLEQLPDCEVDTLVGWTAANPHWAPVLGLSVGLSQEKLRNVLRNEFNTAGHVTLARTQPEALIAWLDRDFELLRLLRAQRNRTYEFADVLIARAGTRVTATQAGASGRRIEDDIEAIADSLGLIYNTRTRFTGRNKQTAPCDLLIRSADNAAAIVVAAKGFDSTGSKLTDAVREIEEMAAVRLPHQFVLAVIDGIGWKSRKADLRRIHALWENNQIDGMYTLATLDQFRIDVEHAARLRCLI